jgi:hypothetical protein
MPCSLPWLGNVGSLLAACPFVAKEETDGFHRFDGKEKTQQKWDI